jgi:hypothetical protein
MNKITNEEIAEKVFGMIKDSANRWCDPWGNFGYLPNYLGSSILVESTIQRINSIGLSINFSENICCCGNKITDVKLYYTKEHTLIVTTSNRDFKLALYEAIMVYCNNYSQRHI